MAAKTGHIRSVGDAPNGLVAVSLHGDRPHFVISPKTKPPPSGGPGEVTVRVEHGADPELEQGAVAITAEEAIEASLHCKRTPWVLWGAAHVTVQERVKSMLDTFSVEDVKAAAEFAKEVRDQLAVNGLIHKGRKRS